MAFFWEVPFVIRLEVFGTEFPSNTIFETALGEPRELCRSRFAENEWFL